MTLIEILVAAAIFAVVAFILVGLVYEYNVGGKRLSAAQRSRTDIAHLLDQWEADQSSAEAVFIPDADVLGADNRTTPHEVAFYSKDASNRPYFWAYYYDGAQQTLQRYDYANPGSPASKDGNAFEAITRFAPSLHALSEISNSSSPIYMPIFSGARDYDVKLGMGASVVGGTHIVHVDIATAKESVPVELEAGGAPSGFTVVLNYTPAPKPTPASTLRTWPAAVRYGVSGGPIGKAGVKPSFNVASVINGFLGGGIAQAATPCTAQAYTDSTFSTPDTVGDPIANALLGAPPDVHGCYGGQIVAYEASGATGTFGISPGLCGTSVLPGTWNPSSVAVQAYNATVGGSPAIASCNVIVGDGGGTTPAPLKGLVTAQVIAQCVNGGTLLVGATCFGKWPALPGTCDPSVGMKSGFIDDGSVTFSVAPAGLGTFSDTSSRDWTFTRTAPGTVTLTEKALKAKLQLSPPASQPCMISGPFVAATWTIN